MPNVIAKSEIVDHTYQPELFDWSSRLEGLTSGSGGLQMPLRCDDGEQRIRAVITRLMLTSYVNRREVRFCDCAVARRYKLTAAVSHLRAIVLPGHPQTPETARQSRAALSRAGLRPQIVGRLRGKCPALYGTLPIDRAKMPPVWPRLVEFGIALARPAERL